MNLKRYFLNEDVKNNNKKKKCLGLQDKGVCYNV